MKRSLSIFLCIAMLLGMTPVQAYASAGESAANAPKEEWTQTSVKVAPDPGLPENDELYDGYVQQLFYGKEIAVFGTAAGERLIGDEKLLYDALVPLIRQLASGQRASSFLCIGQEVTDDKGSVYPVDAEVVFAEPMISDASLGRVVDALLADLPYEMYWYDKVDGCEAAIIHGSTMLQICLRFTVADNYRGTDDYSVDTTKAKTATAAAANAQKLIDDYASASDYEKLVFYKDEICDLVSYDHAAADDGHFSTDNDPWQLIYVFDGDDSTNVVCEGYSKAFMYLCDMTAFSGDVSCYTVMGTMDDGNHMWNVVSIGGGNYLADVTNSDAGTVGQDGSFFLTGASGSAAEGYVVDDYTYRYDEDTRNLWGTDAESILTLKNTPYDPSAEGTEIASGTCGKNLTWTLGSDGVLVISGTGAMAHSSPWSSHQSDIKGVVIKSGVTSIGSWTFYECSSLTSIVIPDSVTSIGDRAFTYCRNLTNIELPDTLTSIGDVAFAECTNLTSIELPDTIISIGDSAFAWCSNLTSIELPDNIISISDSAFDGCSGLTSIKLPNTITSIGDSAFSLCSNLTSIVIPDSVTSIGSCAFFRCENLTSIELPDNIISISDSAFSECKNLTSIELPDNLTSIGTEAFSHCHSLTSIEFPDTLTSIREWAFLDCCRLRSITFNGNAPNIASDAFQVLHATCYYPSNNETWTEAVMQNYGGKITWLVIGSTQGPGGGSGSGEEPGEGSGTGSGEGSGTGSGEGSGTGSGEGSGTGSGEGSGEGSGTGSGEGSGSGSGSGGGGGSGTGSGSGESSDDVGEITWTFKNGVLTISGTGKMPDYTNNNEPPWDDVMDEITSLVIEPGVTSIGIYAFSSASIVEIDLPSSIAYIEPGAFAGCDKIASITVAKGNQKYTVVDGVLFNRNMTTLVLYPSASTAKTYTIPNTVTALSGYAFSKARNLKQINIPNTVQELGSDTFSGCTNLTEVIIPNGVTEIGRAVFYGCTSLKYVSIPNSVGTIGLCAFYNCESLSNLQIPDIVTTIGNQAFYGCSSLVELTIPDSVVSIGDLAFGGCKSLVSVYLGQGVTSMEEMPFDSQYLKDIQVAKGNQYFASVDGVLFNKDKTELLCYPGGREVQSYTIPNTVTDIGSYAFFCCMNLTSMVIPDGVTSIGSYAFASCINLTDIQIPNSVTSIGPAAFSECINLISMDLPDGVTDIGNGMFYYCVKLASIEIPDGVTSIGNNVFEECYSLTSIEIPDSVTSIGSSAFSGCSSLTNIEIPDGVSSINSYTFTSCKNLTTIKLPDNLTSIGITVFAGCSNLTNIKIPDGVTSISSNAFANCSSLTSIEIPDSVTSIGSNAFDNCSSLTSIELPDNLTNIDKEAFYGCKSLTSIELPDGVTSINSGAFFHCSSLNQIFFRGNAPAISSGAFSGVTATAYYPPDDATWTSDKRVGYGGSITWVPFRVKLDAPEVNASNDASTGKIKLTWQAVDGATQYKVYRATSKTGKYKLMKTTTGTSYTNTSSQVGEKFYYYVVAETPYGLKSAPSSIVNRTCGLPRPVVTASNVASSGKIKLTWEDIDGAVEYKVLRATSKTGPYSIVKTTTGTSYTNTSAEAGNSYYYKVIAVHADSAANSAYSEVKSRTCDLPRPVVTASNVASSGKIKLTWEDIDGAVQYKVYRATSKSGEYKLMKTTTDTAYTNTSAEAGNAYYYKVVAVHNNSAANSSYSEIKSRTCDLPRPVVTASNVASSGKIKLTWNDVASAVEYKVYRATSKSGEYKLMKTTTSTSYTNTSAEAGNTYYYKVVAVHSNSAANSAYSEVKSRTCDLARPVVSVTLSSSGKPVVSWNVVSGAEKYKVYMYDANGNLLKTSTTSKTKLTYTSAVKGDTYTYQVVAVHSNTNANSAKSTGVSIKCK